MPTFLASPRLNQDYAGYDGQPKLSMDADGVKDVLGYRLWDTLRYTTAGAINNTAQQFFSVPLGQQQAIANDPTTRYTKQLADTNLRSAGSQLPRGQIFQVASLQVEVLVPNAIFAANSSGDNAGLTSSELAVSATVAGTASYASAIVHDIIHNATVAFKVGDKTYEEGLLVHFPSPYGISGYASATYPGTAVAGQVTAIEGVANNGFGGAYQFPMLRTIDAGRQFAVELRFYDTWTPARNFQIRCTLEGLLYRSVQ